MSKAGFPVAEATRNYLELHLPSQRELAYLTPEEITKLVTDACQKMAEYGWMRGWEAARNQGQPKPQCSVSIDPDLRHNYKSEGTGQCGICFRQRGGYFHGR